MNSENKNSAGQSDAERFANTERDEATLGKSQKRNANPDLADGDQPTWQPPENIPEPRPAEPIMNSTQPSNTNSPA